MKKLFAFFFVLAALTGCTKAEADLTGKNYKLVDADSKVEITLGFAKDENRYYGKAVNNYFGTYKVQGAEISFSPAGSTMMAAPEDMMMAEAAYFQFLPQVQVFKLEGKLLTLTAENGKTMVFEETAAPAEE